MKNILILTMFTFLVVASKAQDSLLTYTEVVQIDGATKDQLFTRARQWFNDAWKSSKDVLQITDKESGELSGKGIISSYYDNKGLGLSTKVPVDYDVTVSVFVKDGRYKYEFTNIKARPGKSSMETLGVIKSTTTCPVKFTFASQKKSDALYENLKTHLSEEVILLVENLKKAMAVSKSKTDF